MNMLTIDMTNMMRRYDDLFMIHSGKWIYIRFNPDNNISKVNINVKLDALMDKIAESVSRVENEENTELVEIHKMYY